jgi:hypothetical protein
VKSRLGRIASTALVGLAGIALLSAPSPASADEPIGILVLKEHGVGSASNAQSYVDELVGAVADANGWSGSVGKYVTRRAAAKGWINASKPHYGIMSLGAFLELRGPMELEVVGKAEVSRAGGRQYHIISKNQSSLAGCKGKTLASDHASDGRFVDRVASGGQFTLSEFQVVATKRPMQTVKKVTRGEAECALVDDAQVASLAKVEGGADVRSVWKSPELPPMVVVAFPAASKPERNKFKSKLGKVCKGQGKGACDRAGIERLVAAGPGAYAAVVKAYGK